MSRAVSLLLVLVFVSMLSPLFVDVRECRGFAEIGPPPPKSEADLDANSAYVKGLRAMMEKRLDDAAGYFEETIKVDPESYNTHLTLATIYRIQKKDGDAERVYRHAIETRPKAPGAYEALMVMLTDLGRGKDAVEVGEAARAQGIPDKGLPTLGWSYYMAGDKEKAKACFDRNLEYRPDDYLANRDMGVYHLEGGNAEEALGFFEKADSSKPGQAVTAYLAAVATNALGDEQGTRTFVREMVVRDNGFKFNTGKYAKQTLPHMEPPDFGKYLFSLSDEFLNKMKKDKDGAGAEEAEKAE